MKLSCGVVLGMLVLNFGSDVACSSDLVVRKICKRRCISTGQYPVYEASFRPKQFWAKPMEYQLRYLQDAITECDLLTIAPKYHGQLEYTDQLLKTCLQPKSYPIELEKRFEKAVWEILSKEYKISFDGFVKSLRLHLISLNPEYSEPLLRHFSNYLVPRYEFYYKNEQCLKDNIPYKTLKHPSEFEVVTGTPDVGVVVYEQKE